MISLSQNVANCQNTQMLFTIKWRSSQQFFYSLLGLIKLHIKYIKFDISKFLYRPWPENTILGLIRVFNGGLQCVSASARCVCVCARVCVLSFMGSQSLKLGLYLWTDGSRQTVGALRSDSLHTHFTFHNDYLKSCKNWTESEAFKPFFF